MAKTAGHAECGRCKFARAGLVWNEFAFTFVPELDGAISLGIECEYPRDFVSRARSIRKAAVPLDVEHWERVRFLCSGQERDV